MKRAALVPIILSASVVALLALQVATSNRLAKLQDQIAKLEDRPVAGGAPAVSTAPDPAGAGLGGTTGVVSGAPAPGTDAPAGAANPGGADVDTASPLKSPRRAGEALSEADVEALIEKKLAARDKKNPLASFMSFEDPMTVMERELKLSPIQKTRIAGHMKERDDANMDLWQSEEGRKDWRANQEKSEELRKKYHESVKRELDLAQQDKYEELKKSGKLHDFGGSSVVIGGFSTSDEDGAEAPAGK